DALAGPDRKVDVDHRTASRCDGQLLDLELRAAKRIDPHSLDLGRPSRRCATHHRRDELRLADVADPPAQDELAIPQDADSLTDLVNLLVMVGDVQHSDANFQQAAYPVQRTVQG